MLKFRKGVSVNQVAAFDILAYNDLELYNRLLRQEGVVVISERDVTVPGTPPNFEGVGGTDSQLMRIVKYSIDRDKLKNGDTENDRS